MVLCAHPSYNVLPTDTIRCENESYICMFLSNVEILRMFIIGSFRPVLCHYSISQNNITISRTLTVLKTKFEVFHEAKHT